MKALVTGAAGQLGLELTRVFGQDGEVVALPRARLDICDHEAVLHVTRETRPDVILNCAAYNDVDGAETDPVAAMQVNGFGVRSLAAAAREVGAILVHYSTDYVFNGQTRYPYKEDEPVDPISAYGSYGWNDGNSDGDDDVDLADYNAVASNFQPLGYGAAAVPEPSTALLVLLALLLVSACRRLSVLS